MKKATILLILATVLAKFAGFFRDIVLSYFYGASNISDIYLISLTIPSVIFAFIGAGITTAYIPMYSKIEKEESLEECNRFTNNIVNLTVLICTIIIAMIFIFTEPIVKLFASGFEGETLILAIKFTRITVLGVYFTGLTYLFQGYLNIKKSYVIPSLMSIPFNIVIMVSIAMSYKYNLYILAYGSVFASAIRFFILMFLSYKKDYSYNPILKINDKNLRNMIFLALPVILGTSVQQINQLVDRTIASSLEVGGISALSYAHRLDGFIQGIFVLSIATVLYPTISKLAVNNEIMKLKKNVSQSINAISLLVLPATIGSMIFSVQIVTLLFGRGAFDLTAIVLTSNALFYYSIGMIGFGLRSITSKVFYSLQDTKTPMINAAIGMILNIILNIVLSRLIGLGGLALATSISAIITSTLMFKSLRKKIGPFGMKQISISFLKILFASLVMGGLAKLSFNYLTASLSQNLSLMLGIGVGAVSYFVIIYFMKIEDVDVIVGAIKKKFGRGAA